MGEEVESVVLIDGVPVTDNTFNFEVPFVRGELGGYCTVYNGVVSDFTPTELSIKLSEGSESFIKYINEIKDNIGKIDMKLNPVVVYQPIPAMLRNPKNYWSKRRKKIFYKRNPEYVKIVNMSMLDMSCTPAPLDLGDCKAVRHTFSTDIENLVRREQDVIGYCSI